MTCDFGRHESLTKDDRMRLWTSTPGVGKEVKHVFQDIQKEFPC